TMAWTVPNRPLGRSSGKGRRELTIISLNMPEPVLRRVPGRLSSNWPARAGARRRRAQAMAAMTSRSGRVKRSVTPRPGTSSEGGDARPDPNRNPRFLKTGDIMKETKTASATPEARAALHEMMAAFEAFKGANDARL